MKSSRPLLILVLVLGLAAPTFAQSESQTQAPPQPMSPPQSVPTSSSKGLVYGGGAVFAAGMATALYSFVRAGNGEYATFGEATARNKKLGAAGIATAFAGGTMMFLGSRARRYAPSAVALGPTEVSASKSISW
jgi:hypothetical protein